MNVGRKYAAFRVRGLRVYLMLLLINVVPGAPAYRLPRIRRAG